MTEKKNIDKKEIEKFDDLAEGWWDPEGDYVRRWVTELQDLPANQIHGPHSGSSLRVDYPPPMIDHTVRSREALLAYRRAREWGSKR